jgi:hypothetical protein
MGYKALDNNISQPLSDISFTTYAMWSPYQWSFNADDDDGTSTFFDALVVVGAVLP